MPTAAAQLAVRSAQSETAEAAQAG